VLDLLAALERPPLAGVCLAAVVFEATERLVPVTHPQPFQADVILARGRVPKELAGRPVTGSWTARSVSLVADRSSPREVRLKDLATFPLEDPGPAGWQDGPGGA
jgi:hypothetical protein